jgi:two-component system, NarL family, response regulator NreC
MNAIRILIADDHALIRGGLRTLLAHEPAFEVVVEASNGLEAIEAAERERPHVAILDIGMPCLNGIEAGRRIVATIPSVQLVMLTVYSDEGYLLNALRAGARGYVLKSSAESEIVEAVRAVSQGKAFFSPKVSRILADDYMRFLEERSTPDAYNLLSDRERQILQLLAEGQTNKDIATILNLSPMTVMCHRQHIFQKLDLHNISDLILYAIRKGVIPSQFDRSTQPG